MMDIDLGDIYRNKPGLFGHVVENFVATDVAKLLSFSNVRAELLHFRTSDGKEVDFILKPPDGNLFTIEIKRAEPVSIQDFKATAYWPD